METRRGRTFKRRGRRRRRREKIRGEIRENKGPEEKHMGEKGAAEGDGVTETDTQTDRDVIKDRQKY